LKQIREKVKVAYVFGFDKNLIKETEIKDMKWKAKRPKDSIVSIFL